jgi:hypothetical protein
VGFKIRINNPIGLKRQLVVNWSPSFWKTWYLFPQLQLVRQLREAAGYLRVQLRLSGTKCQTESRNGLSGQNWLLCLNEGWKTRMKDQGCVGAKAPLCGPKAMVAKTADPQLQTLAYAADLPANWFSLLFIPYSHFVRSPATAISKSPHSRVLSCPAVVQTRIAQHHAGCPQTPKNYQ